MNSSELESAVVEFVNRQNYKPVKPRIIAKRLGLDEEGATQLKHGENAGQSGADCLRAESSDRSGDDGGERAECRAGTEWNAIAG